MIDRRISSAKHEQYLRRKQILKNLVMRLIVDTRIKKLRPNLSDVLEIFQKKYVGMEKEAAKKAKLDLLEKLKQMYSREREGEGAQDEQDIKYERVMSSFDRV